MRIEVLLSLACGSLMTFAATPVHNRVIDYVPAPGQFINVLPEWESGDDAAVMAQKAYQYMVPDEAIITLGAWGGYVTVGFDHTIVNVTGKRDFYVEGNAFQASESTTKGGSSEPGVIMVAYDINKNGIPDDNEWFEIAGSEYANSVHNYEIVYEHPATNTEDINWHDNKGGTGIVKYMGAFHTQPHWPQWLDDKSTLTFVGTQLPDNYRKEGTDDDPYYVLARYDYGYADNYPNFSDDEHLVRNEGAMIDIDWAVDKDGNSVKMPGVDFVRIYTGVNKYNGILGENSTEVGRVINVHTVGLGSSEVVDESVKMDEKVLADFLAKYAGIEDVYNDDVRLYVNQSGLVTFCLPQPAIAQVFDLKGTRLFHATMPSGNGTIDLSAYATGIYFVSVAGKTMKVMKR